jgi:hypothetical protein
MRECQKRAHMKHRAKDLANRKYLCVSCDKAFRDKYTLTNHLNSRVHNPKPKVSYYCPLCNYRTKNKALMRKHNNTNKHKNKVLANSVVTTP